MAKLGNLYFDVSLRDKTSEQLKKIEAKLTKLQLGVKDKTLQASVRQALAAGKYSIKVKVDGAALQRSVQAATKRAYSTKYTASMSREDLTSSKVAVQQQKLATELQRTQREAARAAQAQLRLEQAHRRASSAAGHQSAELGRLSSAAASTSGAMGSLGNMLGNAFSLYGIQALARNIIQVGGELQNQRLAIKSILGDAGQAQTLFSQIEDLAIRSPFGMMDLTSYAKQLTAFSIPYNELYDTMKRLADISAAVGVDMSRIILAFGQVKASGFLKGSELRQLTEANLPIIQSLIDKYSELEGKAVSAADIYTRVSAKEIPFQDVKEALWDLTDEGGKFYNIQEVLSESLKSKWKNLADAIDIMFSKMADMTDGPLIWLAEGLTAATQNWMNLISVLGTGFAVWKGMRVMIAANTAAVGANNLQTLSAALVQKQYAAAVYKGTVAQKSRSASTAGFLAQSKALTRAETLNIIETNKMTRSQVLAAIALRQIKGSAAMACVGYKGLTAAEVQAAAGMGVMQRMGLRMRLAFVGLTNSVKAFGAALKANWVTLLIGAVVEAIAYFTNKSEEGKEAIEDLRLKCNEAVKSITEKLGSLKDVEIKIEAKTATPQEVNTAIEDMYKQMLDSGGDYAKVVLPTIFEKGENGRYVMDETERFYALKKALEDVEEAYENVQRNAGLFNDANKATDTSVFGDGLKGNIKDYGEALAEYYKEKNDAKAKYYAEISAAIKEIKRVEGKTVDEVLDLMKEDSTLYLGITAKMGKNKDTSNVSDYEHYLSDLRDAQAHAQAMLTVVQADMDTFAQYIKDQYGDWDFNNLNAVQQATITQQVEAFIDNIGGLTDEVKKQMKDELLVKRFNILIKWDFKTDGSLENELVGWQYELDQLLGKTFTTEIKASASLTGAKDALEKEYKNLQEEADKMKPLLTSANIQFTDGQEITADYGSMLVSDITKQLIADWNHLVGKQKAYEKNAGNLGLSLDTGKEKKSGGSDKDPLAEQLKERTSQIKEAYAEWQKWAELVGEAQAKQTVEDSGVYASLYQSMPGFDPSEYRKNLNSVLERLSKAKTTKKREEVRKDVVKLLFEFSYDENRKGLDEALKRVKAEIDKVVEKWELFDKIFAATGNREQSMDIAFDDTQVWDDASEEMLGKLSETAADKEITLPAREVLFGKSEEEAKDLFGGENELYEQWLSIKERIEDNGVELKVNVSNAVNNIMSTEERIKKLEAERDKAVADYRVSGDYGKFGETADGQDKGEAALLEKYNEEIEKLKASVLELLPAWEQIFGDTEYKSWGQLQEGIRMAEEIVGNAKIKTDADGKPKSFTSSYTDSEGNTQDVTGSASQLSKVKKQVTSLNKAAGEVNPWRQLAKNVTEVFSGGLKGDDLKAKLREVGENAAAVADEIGGLANGAASMFEAMGAGGAADAMGTVGDVMGSVSNIASGFAQGGPLGGAMAAAGEAMNWIGKIVSKNQQKIQEAIEASEDKVSQLEWMYSQIEEEMKYALDVRSSDRSALLQEDLAKLDKMNAAIAAVDEVTKKYGSTAGQFYQSILEASGVIDSKLQARIDAYETGGVYGYQRQLLKEQLDEYQKMYDKAGELKDDTERMEKQMEYGQKIDELKQQLLDFSEELAGELYGINLKDWASQLGDALYEAWQTGADGAEAFGDTVSSIMGDVVNEVMKVGLIQPALTDLQKKLFGDDGYGGWFGKDLELSDDEVMQMADALMSIADKNEAFTAVLDRVDAYMQEKYGKTIKDEDSEGGLQKGIQSVTEETADLLASYINAIRADVSGNREALSRLADEVLPQMNVSAQAQLTQLTMIQQNTARNAELVSEIRDMMHGNITPGKGFKIA